MKRNTKISCDVSREADNMLKAYCLKHERSKGFLLEKMIRKFCGEVEAAPATQVAVVKKETVKRFVPPSILEVQTYMLERGVHISKDSKDEAEKFCDHFESNGWKVGGKTKMVSWKAAVRNWLKGNSNERFTGNNKSSGQKESSHERIVRENNTKYRGHNECGLGMGTNDGNLGRTVDTGQRAETVIGLDNEPFIDY